MTSQFVVAIACLLFQVWNGFGIDLIVGISETNCCYTKEVGGIRYVLADEMDTSPYMCKSNCVYKIDSESEELYCFQNGVLPVSCVNQKAPKITQVPIQEGNESIVQENHFHEETGILVVKVPPHKDYAESVFLFHQDSKTSLLKSDDGCHVSEIPDQFNVEEMSRGFQRKNRMKARQSNTVMSYQIKSRKARYGAKKRAEVLHPEANYLCRNAPVIKTNDFDMTQEDFEKYNRGEAITIRNEKLARQQGDCSIAESAVQTKNRGSCYYWYNPDPNGQDIRTHNIGIRDYTVTCAILNNPNENPTVNCDDEVLCQCDNIDSVTDLVTCYFLHPTTQTRFSGNGRRTNLVQNTTYNSREEGHSVIISSPAYEGYTETDVVMRADDVKAWNNIPNSKVLKIGDVCHIASTQQYNKGSGPRDIAIGIREIKNGNPEDTEKEEIIIKQEILIPDGILTQAERDGLHPDMKEKCGDASIKKYKAPTPSQENTLKNNGVIILDVNDHLGEAAKLSETGSGSWHRPNDDSDDPKLWINEIVSPVLTASCCKSDQCASAGVLCVCNDINGQNFEECYSTARNANFL